ncbi:hypothetical protein HanIR_Chr14g0725131 [Helianthus annuus]|nr:hypothetical protein HanIR_Chr14g0725131 [Helianthus annuus]
MTLVSHDKKAQTSYGLHYNHYYRQKVARFSVWLTNARVQHLNLDNHFDFVLVLVLDLFPYEMWLQATTVDLHDPKTQSSYEDHYEYFDPAHRSNLPFSAVLMYHFQLY